MTTLGNLYTGIGHSKGVIAMTNRAFVDVVETSEPVKAICMDYNIENFGFYYITQTENEGVYNTSLWHFDGIGAKLLDTQQAINPNCKLIYDYENSIMSAIMNEKIYIYSSTGDKLLATYDSAALGGVPVNVAITTVITSENYSNSSSGSSCNITGAGFILMILSLAALKFLRSEKI